MKTYTTQQARAALGLKTAAGVIKAATRLGIVPQRIPALTATGYTFLFTEEQIQPMKHRAKPGRPKVNK